MSKVNLLPHQKQSLEITKDKNKVGYYLDMGLGKTFVSGEKMKLLNENINLVVCQKSKIDDWIDHFETYYPEYQVLQLKKGTIIPTDCNVILVINYDSVWRLEYLKELTDFTLILDESSLIKNTSAKRTKFILKLKYKNLILLSGTPVSGKYEELTSQIHLLGWNISKKAFLDQYTIQEWEKQGEFYQQKIVGYKNIDRLKRKLREYGGVFMKTEDVVDLPEQREISVKVRNTRDYARFKKDSLITVEDTELVGDTSLTKLLYLRQLAGQYNKNKLEALKGLLESTNDRVVIFYNFKNEYEKIKSLCVKLDKPISTVNGDIKDLSNYETLNNTVVLVQYQSGAMGINLQLSNKIIYYTLTLSADLYMQSLKRIHRIGQKNNCLYYYLLVDNSIEHKILETLKMREDFTNQLFEKIEGE
jgi:SNF2 family DNA or RNA helicase